MESKDITPSIGHRFLRNSLPLLVIMLIGLGLRLWGVDHGLPYVYDPDEPLYVVLAGGMLGNLDPNPHWFGNPGTPYLYLLAGVDLLIFLGGLILGVFKSPEDFRVFYHSDPSLLCLGGRLVSLIFAVATIYLLYRVARKFLPELPSLFAALLLAISPLHVEFSRLIRPDTLMTFLVLLSFYFTISIFQEGNPKAYWWAGFFAGLGIATKYPAAIIVPVIILAHFLRQGFGTKNFRLLLLAGSATFLGFFIGSPFLLFELESTIAALIFEGSHANLWSEPLSFPAQAWFYIKVLADKGFTWIGLVMATVAGLWALFKKDKIVSLVLFFIVLFITSISLFSLHWERWAIPLLPFMSLLVAWFFRKLSNWLQPAPHKIPSMKHAFILALALIIVTPLLFTSVRTSQAMAGGDTRTVTHDWMIENIPNGTKVLMEKYSPIFQKDSFVFFYIDENNLLVQFDPEATYKNNFKPLGHIGTIEDLSSIKAFGIEYLVFSSPYNRYLEVAKDFPSEVSVYNQLIANSELIFQTSPIGGKVNGPDVFVYRIRP